MTRHSFLTFVMQRTPMQDAQQYARPKVLCALILFAFGLSVFLSHSVQADSTFMACGGVSCLMADDVAGDGNQDGELTRGVVFSGFVSPLACDSSVSLPHAVLVHRASFPVLPQAPPLV
ncbi:MAG: hypothetical protein EP339_11130 [Gammaproteobacteria bacterium]|nr:hypothetical protein [Marinobacter nitratireducens]TNE74162.1 MAG: hypothetical protein EP339_11130 [Gammaproteobacteria bacterium]